MSEIEIRSIEPGELEAHVAAVAAGFMSESTPERLEQVRRIAVPERSLVALDGSTIVGTAASLPFRLTVPGGDAPAGGVTAVTVQPTHRRRGILRAMMRQQLDDAHERSESVAMLWASEGSIYPRFGYGLASLNARIDAQRDWMRLEAGQAAAQARFLTVEEALDALPPIYDAVRPGITGFYTRSRDWWEVQTLSDDEWSRRGAGPLFRALLELDGTPMGYALYRFKHVWALGVPEGELHVQEAVATTPAAYRELWRFLFGVDLVARVTARRLPVDDPLLLLVSEPTRLRFSAGDGLYLRLVDVGAALGARGFSGDGHLVIGVEDDFCPWNAGSWALEVTAGTVSVSRTTLELQLRLTAGSLAGVYLGAFTFADLSRAGLVEELVEGAVRRADELFRTDRAPWCPEGF